MKDEEAYYERRSDRRGKCIILDHSEFLHLYERKGTEKDVKNLKKAFESLCFDISVHHNLTTEGICRQLQEYAKTFEVETPDCLVVVVLTHGDNAGFLHSESGMYHKSLLWRPFLRKNCPALIGKPKMFFVQACRGDSVDKGVIVKVSKTDSPSAPKHKIPPEPDFCIFYSTAEGEYSWRNTEEGSWFINTLSQELTSNEDDELNLVDLVLKVSFRVALEKSSDAKIPKWDGVKQMPSFVSTLTRNVLLRTKREINEKVTEKTADYGKIARKVSEYGTSDCCWVENHDSTTQLMVTD